MSLIRSAAAALIATGLLGLSLIAPVQAGTPGCVGRLWNPLRDLDYTLMGGLKIAGMPMMPSPKLGEPPGKRAPAVCGCMNGMKSGFGLTMTFWLPAYINDVARQAGCIQPLGSENYLKTFMALSSEQEYAANEQRKENTTRLQIHWIYADITGIAGKSLFEKCNAVTGSMKVSYMTEVDYLFQNDVVTTSAFPLSAVLASVPFLSQMACGGESVANTVGAWQDSGLCAWGGSRYPLTGNSISKPSAQATNMDVTVKYLARAALAGTDRRTTGSDAICAPVYSAKYDPFEHRYQWSFPSKASTRFNVHDMRWGSFIKEAGGSNIVQLTQEAQDASMGAVDSTLAVGSGSSVEGQAGGQTDEYGVVHPAPSEAQLSTAASLVARLPKPLNYPTHESGYMQVWEARQCCLMMLTVEGAIKAMAESLITMAPPGVKELYEFYKVGSKVYAAVTDPVGYVLGAVGDTVMGAVKSVTGKLTSGLFSPMQDYGPMHELS